MDNESIEVARVAYSPADNGPVAVITQANYEADGYEFAVTWLHDDQPASWGNGDDVKGFDTLGEAMAAIAAEMQTFEDENEAGRKGW